MKPAPRVRDMMNRKPLIIDPDTRMGDAARLLLKKKAPAAAVVDGKKHFHGIVSTQGLMVALVDIVYEELPEGPVKNYMDPMPPKLSETSPLMMVAEMFVKGGYTNRAFPVMRDGQLVGLITRLGVIGAVMGYTQGAKDRDSQLLYISALKEMDEPPAF